MDRNQAKGAEVKAFIKVMKALSDPSRVKVVKMLQRKEMCVCEIQYALGIAQAAMTTCTPDGIRRRCARHSGARRKQG